MTARRRRRCLIVLSLKYNLERTSQSQHSLSLSLLRISIISLTIMITMITVVTTGDTRVRLEELEE